MEFEPMVFISVAPWYPAGMWPSHCKAVCLMVVVYNNICFCFFFFVSFHHYSLSSISTYFSPP